MGTPIKLSTPRFRVVLGDADAPDTWAELIVQAIGRDLQAAETLFHRRKWGAPTSQAIKFQAAAAYYALRRTGRIEGEWEQFEGAYLEVSEADDDGDDADSGDGVGPTVPAPEPDS